MCWLSAMLHSAESWLRTMQHSAESWFRAMQHSAESWLRVMQHSAESCLSIKFFLLLRSFSWSSGGSERSGFGFFSNMFSDSDKYDDASLNFYILEWYIPWASTYKQCCGSETIFFLNPNPDPNFFGVLGPDPDPTFLKVLDLDPDPT
jgi:hypothetical protein